MREVTNEQAIEPFEKADKEILDLFQPAEGQVAVYYGRIRNGKTYSATADILDLLARGHCVVANWKVAFDGFDERDSFRIVFWSTLFGRRHFFKYSPENLFYLDPEELISNPDEVKWLSKLVGVDLFIDEGQWIFNSMDKDYSVDKMRLVLHNGHHCRALNIITQRPMNIFKTMRSQVNVWYKCEKRLSWPVLLFQRTSYEDMKDDHPDEEVASEVKTYVADRRVMDAYSTHAMREKDAIVFTPKFEYFKYRWLDCVKLVGSFALPATLRARVRASAESRARREVNA